MRIYSIFAGLSLSALVVQAHAFSSIKIAFPEGQPDKLSIEYKVSTGACPIPKDTVSCLTLSSRTTYKANTVNALNLINDELINFSKTYKNKLVFNPADSINNFIKFSIPNHANICYVDLMKGKPDLLIYIKMDGSCFQ